METSVLVVNLLTDEEQTYMGITPVQAVVAAYAHEHGCNNTWEYDRLADEYHRKHILGGGHKTVWCGNWAARI